MKGAYRLVLDLMYMHGGKLYDDPRFIAGHLGCSVRAWGLHRSALIEKGKLSLSDGLLSNYRADKEMIITRTFQDNQAEKASKPRKSNGLDVATAEPKPSQPEPEPDIEKREAKASAKNTRGSRLSAEWFLPSEWGEWALYEGLGRGDILAEADKFKDYWIGAAGARGIKADWLATWRNWIRKFIADNQKGKANGKTDRRKFDAAINETARRLSEGTIHIDHSSRDPFAAR